MKEVDLAIQDFEKFLGFSISKVEVPIKSNQSHDESLSFNVCQRFYGRDDELKRAIKDANAILAKMLKEYKKNEKYAKEIEIFYSLIGNMYYVLRNFKYAAGYFMKCLSYNKNDITYWIELLFSLRSMGKFKLFEDGIFNFERLCLAWRNDPEKEMTQKKVVELIEKISEDEVTKEGKRHVLGIVQVTRYCNQRCIFCSVPPFNKQPSFGELKKRIVKMKQEGVTELMLSGGEPTFRTDLPKIISFANSLNFDAITMQTNGALLNSQAKIEKLFSAGLSKVFVSFHSYIKKVYDELTNTTANYDKALQALKILNKYNGRLGINITITSLNYQHLPELITFLVTNFPNIHSFSINYCDPLGNAAKNTWIVPKLSDVEPYLYKAMKLLKNANKSFMVDFVPLCFMKGFEDYSTEYRVRTKQEEEMINFFGNDDNNLDRLQTGETHPKKKSESCEACKHNKYCGGLNERYVKIHRFDGVVPVVDKVSNDIQGQFINLNKGAIQLAKK